MNSKKTIRTLAITSTLAFAGYAMADGQYSTQSPMPKAAPDWKIEVVAKTPEVRWPSVVECAPDGRIFVAEDSMDMPGPGNKPVDRILCIHPDGQINVFAEHLYAVFGMRYLDGKLYVHNSPQMTVFTDDNSVGKDPKNLWDSDNPAPWNFGGQFNDHIPSGIRLGMDNYLYVSTGDKGIFGLKSNVDGKTVEIHGGGVLRVRPDGRDVEVYCTGTRNHLDVALNAEDEIFTYDNTDDGRGWWTRYTHMVDGGYYGYPHDYRPDDDNLKDMDWYNQTKGTLPYRPWTLWRMDETGGGSAVGCVGYNEDALPEEYRGNSFNCEWGKGKLQRFHTVRDGATYRIEKMEDIMSSTGGDFRPLGITVTPDGTGFYVTDWNYGGWLSKQERGRLFKLTYTGEMHPAPKPSWYVAAAEAQPFHASLEELLAGLAHPAESVRLVAQRRIAERGQEAVEPLVKLLNDASAPAYARWHAIWTLDLIDGGKSARAAIVAIANDDKADVGVRRQAVRELGTRQAVEATSACIALLNSDDASLRFRAATALGRIGDLAGVKSLLDKLDEKDFFAHYAVFTALKRIGLQNPSAWPAIVKGLASDKAQTRAGTVLAMHEVFDQGLVEALSAFIADKGNSADAKISALAAIAPLHRQRPAWDGHWWGTQPQRNPPPAKTVHWSGTPIVLKTIRGSLNDPDASLRKASLDALQIAPDPEAVAELLAMFNKETDGAVQKAILHALAATGSADALPIAATLLKDAKAHAELLPDAVGVAEAIGSPQAIEALVTLAGSENSPESLTSAIGALGRMRAKKAIATLSAQAANNNLEVAEAAAAALGAVGGREAAQALLPVAGDKRPEVRKAAVIALGNTQESAAIPVLVAAAKDPVTQTEAITALTRHPDIKAADAYLEGIGGKDAGLRSLCRKAIEQISIAIYPIIEDRLDNGPPLTKIAIGELQRIYVKSEPTKNWRIIGPFPIEAPDSLPAASVKDLDHLPDNLVGAEKKTLQWRKASSTREGFIDLAAQYDQAEHVYAYAATEINSPMDRELPLEIGSDDGIILWVNGQEVFRDLGDHAWQADQFHATAHLVKGRNIIVAKIMQDTGPWGFSVAYAGEHSGKLFEIDAKSADVKTYDAFAIGHEGNAAEGSRIFHNAKGVGCIKCHTVAGQGGIVGPDLSDVGAKYSRPQIIESVLYPSKIIAVGFEQTLVRTKDGNVVAGVVRAESDRDLTLYDSSANKIVVRKADIDVRKLSNISVMPEGLQAGITHQQFADLISYLQSLKSTAKK